MTPDPVPAIRQRVEQIAREHLWKVIHAEDQNMGCRKTETAPMFCCYWHGRTGDDKCAECRMLEDDVASYAVDVFMEAWDTHQTALQQLVEQWKASAAEFSRVGAYQPRAAELGAMRG